MLARKAAVVVACVSSALVTNLAAAQVGCWYPNEAKAAQIMQLNTKMMVGALHCRDKTPDVIEDYNTFVAAHRDLLKAHHTILQNRFDREGTSRQGSTDYRDFVTLSANHHSADPAARDVADCASIVALTRMASAMSEGDLLMLAQSLTKAPASGPCRPSAYSFEEEVAAAASEPDTEVADLISDRQPWEPLAPVAASVDPAPAAAIGELPATEPATEPAVLAEAQTSTAQVGLEEDSSLPAAEAPGSDRDVLQAAVAALQAATAALERSMQNSAGN